MFNTDLLIQEGINLPAKLGSALLWNGKQSTINRVETIAKRIQAYMKGKKEILVSELVETLGESADIIFRALNLLKEKGLIKEN